MERDDQPKHQDKTNEAPAPRGKPKFGALSMFGLACVGAAFVGLFIFFVVYGAVASK
ncbi:hypothetical protein M0654_08750 [Rhizobium sp. NTR19]|uniref:Uncharacterized protein n=1 Tax=Neorhizobium turbinariae TaxID=2937795 RepID=A0ABT0IQC2_9HYPH|nr:MULTISPECIES: hypothetical protein [Neorhizobium]MCK8780070.1 hypothetical protein [Neorhizobium turbinariae]